MVGIVTEDPGLASKYQTMLRNVVNSAAPILAELSEFEGKLEVFNVEEDNVPPAVDG